MSNAKNTITNEFQDTVREYEYFHKNILEQLVKFQELSAKLNKNIIRACSTCGCIEINANKFDFSNNARELSFEAIRLLEDHHIKGNLCEDCKDLIEKHMGSCLYYLTYMCNSLNLDFNDIFIKEMDKINLLGRFNIE